VRSIDQAGFTFSISISPREMQPVSLRGGGVDMHAWLIALVFLTFNLPILLTLAVVPLSKRLNKVLKEKALDGSASEATSYSRVTGALGAVILTSFFWAIGNVVLSQALGDAASITRIKPMMDAVSPFFLVGSALFLPYAFNQLKSLFPWNTNAAAAMALAKIPPPPKIKAGDTVQVATQLVIANLSNIDDSVLNNVLAAISTQISLDFGREWNISAALRSQRMTLTGPFVEFDAATDAIIYLGDSSQDSTSGVNQVLGYHSQNHSQLAYGFVYLDACAQANEDWSITLSHEILELLADPSTIATAPGPDPTNNSPEADPVSFFLEVCDPTQGDWYLINGVKVSNFVNKSYFGKSGGLTQTNRMNLTLPPFGARPGGHATYLDSNNLAQDVLGAAVPPGRATAAMLMGPGRRIARRMSRLKVTFAP